MKFSRHPTPTPSSRWGRPLYIVTRFRHCKRRFHRETLHCERWKLSTTPRTQLLYWRTVNIWLTYDRQCVLIAVIEFENRCKLLEITSQIDIRLILTNYDVTVQPRPSTYSHKLQNLSQVKKFTENDHRIQNGQLWQHATDTPFNVQWQKAWRSFSHFFWLYWLILKQIR